MASLIFDNVYLKDYYTLVGPKESDSKLKKFNQSFTDNYFGQSTFEMAEVKMQTIVINNLLKKNKLIDSNIDYLISGDLINQIAISSSSALQFDIPFIGVYSACASFIESMLLASEFISNHNASNILCLTSSHSLTAERQYRYPVEYGSTKPQTATCTATGAAGILLTNEPTNILVKCGSFGKVLELGIKDVNHMGAVMAPACAKTLHDHLSTYNKKLSDYDLILSGDLGKNGLEIMKEYYQKVYHEKLINIQDAGSEIYYENQEMYAGGSGPACLPLYFLCNIINSKKYRKILLLGTGSLHTPVFVNQKQNIPAISHAIEIEVLK